MIFCTSRLSDTSLNCVVIQINYLYLIWTTGDNGRNELLWPKDRPTLSWHSWHDSNGCDERLFWRWGRALFLVSHYRCIDGVTWSGHPLAPYAMFLSQSKTWILKNSNCPSAPVSDRLYDKTINYRTIAYRWLVWFSKGRHLMTGRHNIQGRFLFRKLTRRFGYFQVLGHRNPNLLLKA